MGKRAGSAHKSTKKTNEVKRARSNEKDDEGLGNQGKQSNKNSSKLKNKKEKTIENKKLAKKRNSRSKIKEDGVDRNDILSVTELSSTQASNEDQGQMSASSENIERNVDPNENAQMDVNEDAQQQDTTAVTYNEGDEVMALEVTTKDQELFLQSQGVPASTSRVDSEIYFNEQAEVIRKEREKEKKEWMDEAIDKFSDKMVTIMQQQGVMKNGRKKSA